MTPERWREIAEIFHAVMERPPADRAALLAERCGDDERLRSAVNALLEADAAAAGFGNSPLFIPAAQFEPGRTVGPYRIQGLLGCGGMGEVYQARDTRLGRDVAIKVLPAEWATDDDRLQRFTREARAAAALNHPHICTIYDVGAGGGGEPPYMAMELLEGETLQHRLTRGPIDVPQIVEEGVGLADALDAAHTRKILHRDIKPGNIFLTARGAKLLDFGLATIARGADTAVQATGSTDLTTPGIVIGTLPYMSPEQVRGEPLDGRSDVYSLGLVLYETATGRPAFAGTTPSVVAAAILHSQPLAPRQLRPDLPLALEAIILKAIEKDRDRRCQTASDLRSDLTGFRDAVNAAAGRDAPRRPIRRSLVAVAACAVAILAGVGLMGALAGRHGSAPAPSQAARTDGPHRLVVLPFDNISGQVDDQWLAGAFADSLTLGLRDSDNLVLVNRERVHELGNSAENQLDQNADARVAKLLAVRYYVNGTYLRVGEDVRVVARLVDANDGTIAVQESLTDRFANLLQLQDDLARRFVTALHQAPAVGLRMRTASLVAYQSVSEARDLYLAARYRDAIERLQRSVRQDDSYADAWALLGKSYARLAAVPVLDSGARAEFHSQALAASLRAVSLAPALYEAQVSLALAYRALEQFEPARQAAQRAIDLNPRLAEGYELLATCYYSSPAYGCARPRDAGKAEQLFRKALELDPQLGTAYGSLGAHFDWMGQTQAALEHVDRVRVFRPGDVGILRSRSVSLLYLKRPEEAEQQLIQVAAMAPTSIQDEWVLAGIELMRGDRDAAESRLSAAIERGPISLREIDTARLYGVIGDPRMAARHLERAFKADPSCAAFIAWSPPFAPFRDHPAIQRVMNNRPTPQP